MTSTLASYLGELTRLFHAMEVQNAAGEILLLEEGANAALDLLRSTQTNGGKAMVVGNGGSAAIASHTQNDLCKSVGMRALVFTEPPLLTALANDDGYQTAYPSLVRLWAAPGDLLIAISSSGRSENILRSARFARQAGCRIITLSGFAPDNPLRQLGDVNFYVPSLDYGPLEVVHAALAQYFTDMLKFNQGPG
ncbi:MAG: SIS domain-containing protein [Verrucomicrobiota bacterium]|jgi:D-sedoheptulose 7-phosphate isomerase